MRRPGPLDPDEVRGPPETTDGGNPVMRIRLPHGVMNAARMVFGPHPYRSAITGAQRSKPSHPIRERDKSPGNWGCTSAHSTRQDPARPSRRPCTVQLDPVAGDWRGCDQCEFVHEWFYVDAQRAHARGENYRDTIGTGRGNAPFWRDAGPASTPPRSGEDDERPPAHCSSSYWEHWRGSVD